MAAFGTATTRPKVADRHETNSRGKWRRSAHGTSEKPQRRGTMSEPEQPSWYHGNKAPMNEEPEKPDRRGCQNEDRPRNEQPCLSVQRHAKAVGPQVSSATPACLHGQSKPTVRWPPSTDVAGSPPDLPFMCHASAYGSRSWRRGSPPCLRSPRATCVQSPALC